MTVAPTAKLDVLTDILIVQTWYIEHPQNGAYWEIHCAKQPGRSFGVRGHECRGACAVLLTRDAELVARAEASDATLHRFHAHWTQGRQPDGSRCQVLLNLEAL